MVFMLVSLTVILMVYFGLCSNLSSPRTLGLAPPPSPLNFVRWTTHPILSPQLYFYLPDKPLGMLIPSTPSCFVP